MLGGMRASYGTTYRGRAVRVELSGERRDVRARLRVDGADAAERAVPWPLGGRLEAGGVTAVVRWWWPGRVLTCSVLVPPAAGERRRLELPLEPDPGAPGSALPRFRHDHPRLFA